MLMRYWRLIFFVLLIIGLIYGIGWTVNKFIFKEKWSGGETKIYQVLVSVYDEKNSNPTKDKKSSMKKGYVVGVYEESHEWSLTEKTSYLILKMKLDEKEAVKIVEPVEKKVDTKTITEEQQKMIKDQKKEDGYQKQTEIVSVRKYKIDLEKIGFSDPNSLLTGQSYGDKVFDWGIVRKTD